MPTAVETFAYSPRRQQGSDMLYPTRVELEARGNTWLVDLENASADRVGGGHNREGSDAGRITVGYEGRTVMPRGTKVIYLPDANGDYIGAIRMTPSGVQFHRYNGDEIEAIRTQREMGDEDQIVYPTLTRGRTPTIREASQGRLTETIGRIGRASGSIMSAGSNILNRYQNATQPRQQATRRQRTPRQQPNSRPQPTRTPRPRIRN